MLARFPFWHKIHNTQCFGIEQWMNSTHNLGIGYTAVFFDNKLNDHPPSNTVFLRLLRIFYILIQELAEGVLTTREGRDRH